MHCTVTIKNHQSKKPTIIISKHLAEKLSFSKKKRCIVGFGTQKNYTDIRFSSKQKDNEIFLSSSVIENLHLPLYPTYEVLAKGSELIIGPCIGILSGQKIEDITKRFIKNISASMLSYKSVNGAIILFSLDKVNTEKRLIEGFCYNPQKDTWERGIFPYPLAIYRKSHLNEDWQNHFLSVIGDSVFSNNSFSKWDMYKWFLDEPDILPNIPETRLYKTKQDFDDMLDRYDVIYVKPIWGMKGLGVVKLRKETSRYIFEYRKDGINVIITARNDYEYEKTITELFEPRDHVLQQGIELIDYEGGIVDFRCVMQKNESCKWICNALVARVGAKESVVSNVSSGGSILPAEELLKSTFNLPEWEMFAIKEKFISLCTKVCNALDEYGFNFETLGLDIGMDKNKKLWLIEINNRTPHPAIALRANDILSYYTLLTNPIHYAKALAGFGTKEECKDVL